ncbi:MAG: hypothetical protein II664_01615 [Oscillospiraceae bacterium]|nr:hypothetical protein [Oscillospiraceae bacterium]
MDTAAKKLGCTPEQLKAQLQSGELEKKIRSAPKGSQLSGIAAIMNDPAAMRKLMSDPAAAELIKKLKNGR